MARYISTGIDIGSRHVKVVISERIHEKDREFLKVAGVGMTESKGLRQGYIENPNEAALAIKIAITEAEKAAGVKVSRAFFGVSGVGLEGLIAWGSAVVSRGDGEITLLDLDKAAEAAKLSLSPSVIQNQKIIHDIPLQYKIDNKEVIGGNPLGLKGLKLEVKMFFVTCPEQNFDALIRTSDELKIEVEDLMAAPLAGSLVNLNKVEKVAGCVLANIGAETTSIVVYENSVPTSLEVFGVGSNDITNDIALGLKISLEEAEEIKLGALTETMVSKKKLDDIISARLGDIFDFIETHLKKINRSGLLPAGIVLTGGGASISRIEELGRAALRLPARVSLLQTTNGSKEIFKNGSWSVAYGLSIWGFTGEGANPHGSSDLSPLFKKLFRRLGQIFKPLVP